jgi:hypothetical protein
MERQIDKYDNSKLKEDGKEKKDLSVQHHRSCLRVILQAQRALSQPNLGLRVDVIIIVERF